MCLDLGCFLATRGYAEDRTNCCLYELRDDGIARQGWNTSSGPLVIEMRDVYGKGNVSSMCSQLLSRYQIGTIVIYSISFLLHLVLLCPQFPSISRLVTPWTCNLSLTRSSPAIISGSLYSAAFELLWIDFIYVC